MCSGSKGWEEMDSGCLVLERQRLSLSDGGGSAAVVVIMGHCTG